MTGWRDYEYEATMQIPVYKGNPAGSVHFYMGYDDTHGDYAVPGQQRKGRRFKRPCTSLRAFHVTAPPSLNVTQNEGRV